MEKLILIFTGLLFSLLTFGQTETLKDGTVEKKEGEYKAFNEDSSVNTIGWHNNDKKDSIWSYFNNNGILMVNGFFRNDLKNGEWKYYRENGIIESKGSFINDKEDGTWSFYNKSGNIICQENFINGVRIDSTIKYFNASGEQIEKIEIISDETNLPLFRIIEDTCSTNHSLNKSFFRIGEDALQRFIKLNLTTPYEVVESGKGGKANAILAINPDGSVEVIKIIGSFSKAYDSAVKKLINQMPRWIPATKDGNPIKSIFNLPYSYNLY